MTKKSESLGLVFQTNETENEVQYAHQVRMALSNTHSTSVASDPFVYMDRRILASALAKLRLFELSLNVQGSIIECGVHRGNGLFLFYHLSSIFEPMGLNRHIIGFDTFEGFPSIHSNDHPEALVGEFGDSDFRHLDEWARLQDLNRPIGHVPKISLIKGDALNTIPEYVEANPHLIVSLLYLDFDLYEPTLIALKHLLPLVPKGGVVAFDELNRPKWPGETQALKDSVVLGSVGLRKFTFDPHISYFIKE
jgi:hypothetical protein